jgi:hypothetical protein
MKPLLLLSLAILAAGCTPREDAAIPQNQALPKGPPMFTHSLGAETPADCALRVEFGSYAMGIDRTASAAVDRLLADDPGVTSVQTVAQGREGEKIVCVAVRSDADAERLFLAISRTFPADPRGPLTVSTRTGRRFSAGR